jgi:hypothetical protein
VRRLAAPAIIALALASSLTSLGNGFAFDDLPIIAQDGRIHRLEQPWRFFTQPYWGPPALPALYRPLASLAFAVEWRLGGGSPLPFHLVNVLLYALICLVVYRLAVVLLGPTGGWWSAALFAVHPVHTEAVANAVGQSELWAGLLVVLAVLSHVLARRRGELAGRRIVLITLLYVAACLFKEHAIVLPGLLMLAETTILGGTPARTFERADLRRLWGALALAALAFWTVHAGIVGSLSGDRANQTFWGMTARARLFTMLAVVPEWFRLLLVPVRLKVEYLPQEVERAYAFGRPQLAGAVLALAAGLAALASRRRLPVLTFGILWTAVALTPVSNVLVPSGVVLAERTLFLPSMGTVLAVAGLATWIAGWANSRAAPWRHLAPTAGAVLLLAGALRSAGRQSVWRNHDSFLDQMLVDAPRSYRSSWIRAHRLFAAREPAAGEAALATALALFPDDPQLLAEVADRYRGSGRCSAAVPLYRHSLSIDRRRFYLRTRLIECLIRLDRLDEARGEVRRALSGREAGARRDAALVDSVVRRRERPTGEAP